MPEDPRRRRLIPALCVLGGLGAAGLLAPLLANDKPLAVWSGGRLSFPAAADLPLLGPILSRGGSPADLRGTAAGAALRAPIPYSYRGVHLDATLLPPSRRHLFGTDLLGRDLCARLIHGAAVSLLVGFGATLVALGLGALLGGAGALRGGLADVLLTRAIEVLTCFPPFILALALVTIGGGAGLLPIVLAIGVARAAGAARFVRGEVLRFKGGPLWSAGRAAGATLPRLALTHLLPLVGEPLAVQATFGVAYAILLESGLSFLGVGVQPPTPSWGMILAEGRPTLQIAWWPIVFPVLALALTLAVLGYVGERLATARE